MITLETIFNNYKIFKQLYRTMRFIEINCKQYLAIVSDYNQVASDLIWCTQIIERLLKNLQVAHLERNKK